MASVKTKFSVGLFVIIGNAVALITILWVGMSHLFEKGEHYLTYFDESVQGLDRDSPVKYRGVAIGRVEKINVAPDGNLIEVLLKGTSKIKLTKENEIVAQLKSIGITGIMFIELDRKNKKEIDRSPKINFTTKYPVIPTKPSDIKKFMEGVDGILNQINLLDLDGISKKAKTTLDGINKAVDDLKFKEISADFRASIKTLPIILDPKKWERILKSIEITSSSYHSLASNTEATVSNFNKTVTHIDEIITDNEKSFNYALNNLTSSMKNVNNLISNWSVFVKETESKLSGLYNHIIITLQNLEKSSENLDRFLENTANQPSQLIFGEPPKSRKIEK